MEGEREREESHGGVSSLFLKKKASDGPLRRGWRAKGRGTQRQGQARGAQAQASPRALHSRKERVCGAGMEGHTRCLVLCRKGLRALPCALRLVPCALCLASHRGPPRLRAAAGRITPRKGRAQSPHKGGFLFFSSSSSDTLQRSPCLCRSRAGIASCALHARPFPPLAAASPRRPALPVQAIADVDTHTRTHTRTHTKHTRALRSLVGAKGQARADQTGLHGRATHGLFHPRPARPAPCGRRRRHPPRTLPARLSCRAGRRRRHSKARRARPALLLRFLPSRGVASPAVAGPGSRSREPEARRHCAAPLVSAALPRRMSDAL